MPNSQIDILLKIRSDLAGIKQAQVATRGLNTSLKKTSGLGTQLQQGLSQGFGLAGTFGVAIGIQKVVEGFTAATRAGINFNAVVEQQTVAFRTLLGNLDLAETRIQELVKFAAFTPFELPEIIQANKVLEVLSDGMLSTEAGMRLVGDAAASVGRGFRETAMWMGRVAAGLESGTAVGEATLRLIELGLISGKTAKHLQFLAKEAHTQEEVWNILRDTFSKSAGAMELQSRTFVGLTATMKDTFRVLAGDATKGLFEGIKGVMEGLLEALDALPDATERAVDAIEEQFGRLSENIRGATPDTIGAARETAAEELRRTQKTLRELQERNIYAGNRISDLESERGLPGSYQELFEAIERERRINELKGEREIREAQIITLQKQSKRLSLEIFRSEGEYAAEQREHNKERNEAEKESARIVARNIEMHSEALKLEHLTAKQAQAKRDALVAAVQTDEQRLVTLNQELRIIDQKQKAEQEEAMLQEDLEKRTLVLSVIKDKYDVERINKLLEIIGLQQKLAKAVISEERAAHDLAVSEKERRLDQIRHLKQLVKEEDESASSRQRMAELVQAERAVLGELIADWQLYSQTVTDPKLQDSIQNTIQGLSQQFDRADAGSNNKSLAEQSLADFAALGSPEEHFTSTFDAATSALMDYQVQVGSVFDQLHENMMNIQGALQGGIQDSIEGLIKGTMSWSDAFENVGLSIANSVVSAFANMLSNWITTQITMRVLGKVFGLQAVAAAGSQATALAALWAPAATAASIATLGGASVAGLAAFNSAQVVGTATSTALSAAQIGAGAGLAAYETGGYTGGAMGIVHPREFVTPSDVVDKVGPQFFYDQVNAIRAGGLGGEKKMNMIVVDSREAANRYLESAEGESRIVDIMELNKGRLI